MADLPDHESFARHLGETFVLRPPEQAPIQVELVDAKALAARVTGDASVRKTPFSLLFRVKGASDLPQHTYRLAHAELGEMDLFLVPIGPDAVGMRFEAIFS